MTIIKRWLFDFMIVGSCSPIHPTRRHIGSAAESSFDNAVHFLASITSGQANYDKPVLLDQATDDIVQFMTWLRNIGESNFHDPKERGANYRYFNT